MSTFAFTQSIASCASFKSVRGRSAPKPVRGAQVIRAANLMDTCRSSGLTAFADAVEKNGLTGEINGGTFTIFAPTNEAMGAFTNPDGTHSTVDVLKFHCIKGKIASKHITNYPLIMTLEGTKIAIDSKTTPGQVEVGAPPQGTQGLSGRVDGGFIKQMDIEADNGVIHVIDGVASPKAPLIGQNGGYVAGTVPGSGEGRTGLDTKVTSKQSGGGGGW